MANFLINITTDSIFALLLNLGICVIIAFYMSGSNGNDCTFATKVHCINCKDSLVMILYFLIIPLQTQFRCILLSAYPSFCLSVILSFRHSVNISRSFLNNLCISFCPIRIIFATHLNH